MVENHCQVRDDAILTGGQRNSHGTACRERIMTEMPHDERLAVLCRCKATEYKNLREEGSDSLRSLTT